jgi:polyphosphate kinase
VEVLVPVRDERIIRTIREDVLATYLADTVNARQMQPDGTYIRKKSGGKHAVCAQEKLLRRRGRPAKGKVGR